MKQTKGILHQSEEKTTKKKTRTIKTLLYITAVFLCTAVFLHIFFPAKEVVVTEARSKHKKELNDRKKYNAEIIKDYELFVSGEISSEEARLRGKEKLPLFREKEALSLNLFQSLNEIKKEVRVNHFKNRRVFYDMLGVGLYITISSIVFLLIAQLKELRDIKTPLIVISGIGIYSGVFKLTWIFSTLNDLPYLIYIVSIIIISITITLLLNRVLHDLVDYFKSKYSVQRIDFLEDANELAQTILKKKGNE